jgi:hypothetical protein
MVLAPVRVRREALTIRVEVHPGRARGHLYKHSNLRAVRPRSPDHPVRRGARRPSRQLGCRRAGHRGVRVLAVPARAAISLVLAVTQLAVEQADDPGIVAWTRQLWTSEGNPGDMRLGGALAWLCAVKDRPPAELATASHPQHRGRGSPPGRHSEPTRAAPWPACMRRRRTT